jgi:hypothetical protein
VGTSQRVSCGFHRLGLFLAVIPLLAAAAVSAHWVFIRWMTNANWHDLWAGTTLYQALAITLEPAALALPVSLAVYGVVRAIGWVVAGFVGTQP